MLVALSYVWGDPNDNDIAIVDNCPVHITSDLASALRHLRDLTESCAYGSMLFVSIRMMCPREIIRFS